MTINLNLGILVAIILVLIILILIRLFQILSGVRKMIKDNNPSIKSIITSTDDIAKSATGIAKNVDENKENITSILEGSGKITNDVADITEQAKGFVDSATTKADAGVGNLNSALKSASDIMSKFGGKVE